MNKNYWQHAIKNIGRKVENINDITFNKIVGSMKFNASKCPTFLIANPLGVIVKNLLTTHLLKN